MRPRSLLGAVGAWVGARRPAAIAVALAGAALAVAILATLPMSARLDFEDGYTSTDAPSIRELQSHIDFFGNKGIPWYQALFASPKYGNGSMIDSREFNEFKEFYLNLKKRTIKTEGERNYSYYDYCGTMCSFNDVTFKTWSLSWFGMEWPTTYILSYTSNIGKNFFQREYADDGTMSKVNLSALYFMSFINSSQTAAELKQFEGIAQEMVDAHNADPKTKTFLHLHGARGMQAAIEESMGYVGHFILAGFCLLAVFTGAALVFSNKTHEACSAKVLLLFPVTLLIPLLATLSAAGTHVLGGAHFNTLMMLTPVVAFAIGLDGMFVLYHSWLQFRQKRAYDKVEHQMREVFACSLPSPLSHLLLVPALLAACLVPIEEFANLSVFIASLLAWTFFYQVFLFSPVMSYCAPLDHYDAVSPAVTEASRVQFTPVIESHPSWWYTTIVATIAKKLTDSAFFRVGVVFIYCLAFALPAYTGVSGMQANLDYRHLLRPEMRANRGVEIMSDIVWPDFLHMIFTIEQPPDFGNPEEYAVFKSFIRDVESMPGAMGAKTNMMWINDFKQYTKEPAGWNETRLQMDKFKSFITDDIYRAWASGVRFQHDEARNTSHITKMLIMVAFNGTRSLADKAQLLLKCRELASRTAYAHLDVVPFDTEVRMVDVILQIPAITYSIPSFLFICLFLSVFLVSWNVMTACVACFMAASTYFGTLGLSSLLGVTLNPFSVAMLLLGAVMSARHSLHLCLAHTNRCTADAKWRSSEDHLRDTLAKALLPTLQSTLAGALPFLPLLLVSVRIFYMLGVVSACLLLSGGLHSLLFLPCLLAALPSGLFHKAQ